MIITPLNYGKLSCKAFRLTAFYDAMIAEYFTGLADEKFPELLTKAFRYKEELRYGENPTKQLFTMKVRLKKTLT